MRLKIGSLALTTESSNKLQRLNLYAPEGATVSEFGRRESFNIAQQPLPNSMSARSSLTREFLPANTDPRELDSLLVGLGKHPTPNQVSK